MSAAVALSPVRKRITRTTISPHQLTCDHTVQRILDPARVRKILVDFSIEAVGVIHVSKRDSGIHHIMDGQHRVAAVHDAGYGDTPVECLLYEGLSRADEAALFRKLNNTRIVHVVDKFRVRVVEEEPVATRLNNALEKRGWAIPGSKTPAEGRFTAVSALEKLYRATAEDDDDLGVVEMVIEIASAAWGYNQDGLRAEIITGLGAVIGRHGDEVDREKLVAALTTYEGGPVGLAAKAKQLHSWRGGRLADAVAEIIVELHNKKRTKKRLPAWRG